MISCNWVPCNSDTEDGKISENIIKEAFQDFEPIREGLFLLARDSGEPSAAGYYGVPNEEGKIILGPVVVRAEKRNEGLGGLIMRMLIRKAFDSGFDRQYALCQDSNAGFLDKLGFIAIEPGLMEHNGDVGGGCQ